MERKTKKKSFGEPGIGVDIGAASCEEPVGQSSHAKVELKRDEENRRRYTATQIASRVPLERIAPSKLVCLMGSSFFSNGRVVEALQTFALAVEKETRRIRYVVDGADHPTANGIYVADVFLRWS